MKKVMICVVVLVCCLLSAPSFALVTYGFTGITNNHPGTTAVGEAQLFMDVSDAGGGQTLFTFRNEGPESSSICQIYFDDNGILQSLASIDNSDPGVAFSMGGSPPVLPGGNNAFPAFVPTTVLTVSSDPPTQPNGVNPGESVGLLYNLQGGQSFDNVTNAISNGELRVGIHVQGFVCGASESFMTTTVPVVPAPAAIVLGSIGSLAVATLRTLRNRKRITV